ncbi:hypothetical protein [Microbulbifer variabilis]|uniref:hypothetical protein n=1 Tax=Microbulbifer variabilis TaxID=266805 RepID=UPI001CFD07EE|nr:hypothetical protein [Microbulbifer variabilis]
MLVVMSAYSDGLEIARRIAGYVVSKGNVVINGLALGIYAAAHEGALAAGGVVVNSIWGN